jgi:ATP-dependent RNA helicase RhlE
VATDIAARGIDIDQLPQVVNFELPNVPEDYVHRIGRTGRAGTTGSALSLVDDEELSYLRDIEKLIKRSIVRVEIEPGFVPPAKADLMSDERPPRPPQGRGGQRQGQGARQGQPGGRSASGRSSQAKPASAGAKPAGGRSGAPGQPTQARKPRPQAALFSSKPGTRGH